VAQCGNQIEARAWRQTGIQRAYCDERVFVVELQSGREVAL